MGFAPTFYAGRPKLSEVTIDSDLDMGGRTIRAGRIDSPYMPETWPTEVLDWGDGEETTVFSKKGPLSPSTDDVKWTNPSSYARQIRVTARQDGSGVAQVAIIIDGVEVYSRDLGYVTFEAGPFWVPAGKQIQIVSLSSTAYVVQIDFYDTGLIGGPKTFNLTGKWLALGIDMKGLAATVKIQGVEIPYSDYAKYFPLAPTELKFPGGWDASQVRPVVEVYV